MVTLHSNEIERERYALKVLGIGGCRWELPGGDESFPKQMMSDLLPLIAFPPVGP